MALDQPGHDFGEPFFIFRCLDCSLCEREERGEGVDVVVVDFGNVRVGDDYEGEVAN